MTLGASSRAGLGRSRPALIVAVLAGLVLLQPAGAGLSGLAAQPHPWEQTQKITPADAAEDGQLGHDSHWGVHFGSELAVDGDTMVVGTQHNKNSDSGRSSSDGYDWAYVFHRQSAGEWVQTAKLVPQDAHQGDTFAYSLAVDDEAGVIAVGNPAAQEVYVFEQQSLGFWSETTVLSEGVRDFGFRVAVDEGTLLASGVEASVFRYEQGTSEWSRAAVYPHTVGDLDVEGDVFVARSVPDVWHFDVFRRTGGSWEQTAELLPPTFGSSEEPFAGVVDLAEDGRTVVFGAATHDWTGPAGGVSSQAVAEGSGSAWIHEFVDGEWVRTAEFSNPTPHPSETFGTSVAVQGDRIVVGAPGDLHSGGERGGAAYVYEDDGDGWTLTWKLKNEDGTAYGGGDWLGESVELGPAQVLVGAPFDDNRRDGTPAPIDDNGDIPPCVHPQVLSACDHGESAGSIYAFEPISAPLSTLG